MLTDAQLTDARRYCGYDAYGSGTGVGFQSWRYFTEYGTLEFKLANLTDSEYAVLITYLTQLNALELAIVGAGDNLDTDSAAVWHHNKNEVADRVVLFDSWRLRLCQFIGIPPGIGLVSGSTRRLVV